MAESIIKTGFSPISQTISGSYAVNSTLQIESIILSCDFIVIGCGRYGYGTTMIFDRRAITAGFYTSGVGAYISDNRKIRLSISTSGLITVLEANDPLNFMIVGF